MPPLPALVTLRDLVMGGFGLGFFVLFFSWGTTLVLRVFFRLLGL